MENKIIVLAAVFFCSISCSWRYEADFSKPSAKLEKVTIKHTGRDLLYGEAPPSYHTISYPVSARDVGSGIVDIRDVSEYSGKGEGELRRLSGYLKVNPSSEVEVRVVRRQYREDGSYYTIELPINGVHKFRGNQ